MQPITTFDSTKEALSDMLQSIKTGKTQLSDFQRGWIWDDEHIKSLLASISLSYPIGAVMMLQTGNTDVRFKPRLIEGLVMENPGAGFLASCMEVRLKRALPEIYLKS
ncbi:MAG: DUF262 domain-containing protein [Candidatus Vecturithrix sp.]|jgi:uncharacterized protein with ParB-like and HNH nuclease domain|nr:DUF262 domain-containing protein [Candidatus Vecturithrix sp.]